MDRLHCMKVAVCVADTGSFAEAARRLRISAAAATRAVAFLEKVTGARLFHRSTRLVRLTDAGQHYVEDCRRLLAEIEEAETSAGGAHAIPSGVLTITAPVLFGQLHVMPLVAAFLDANPGITCRILLFDRVVNLIEEGIDVAVRIGAMEDSSDHAIRVGAVRQVFCAAPDYLARYGNPAGPEDLVHHRIIATTSSSASVDWHFGTERRVPKGFAPGLYCNTVAASIAAAEAGWGIVRALSYQVAALVKKGSLQMVLDDHDAEPLPIHIVHPDGRRAAAKTRAFIDFAVPILRTPGRY